VGGRYNTHRPQRPFENLGDQLSLGRSSIHNMFHYRFPFHNWFIRCRRHGISPVVLKPKAGAIFQTPALLRVILLARPTFKLRQAFSAALITTGDLSVPEDNRNMPFSECTKMEEQECFDKQYM
jgi:hypothetical protein